ncbi:MAG: triphosphoribosyl-dephospho-CoA synthase [Methanocorpusculum sp.]|nr:triphosphoribosyl-dephospho-CoA synthase [Methanocorpusculum sp.]
MPERMNLTEYAELAMLFEVCAKHKPGNVDREHDYDDTRLEHFLCSAVRSRSVFENSENLSVGEMIFEAVKKTNIHSGGNTHFGAFILLAPLIKGKGVSGAAELVKKTSVEDAVLFYKAFGLTQVRMNKSDDIDVNDPASIQMLRDKKMTLYNVMEYSSENDMVAREWINGFALTKIFAEKLLSRNCGTSDIPKVFIEMMSEYSDTFIAKKFGAETSEDVSRLAKKVTAGETTVEDFDEFCIREGINPGSLADICIAGIFTALLRGWKWDY